MKTYYMGLCEDRHPLPVDKNIFPNRVERTWTTKQLEAMADKSIPEDCERLELYATGLMVAMLAVVAVCAKRGIKLAVYNYDGWWKTYNRQSVLD